MAGRITAPASAAAVMFSISTSDSGVSRGTRISLRRLLQVDLGGAVDQVDAGAVGDGAERAVEQGQTTMPSVGNEPLAMGAR